MTTQLKNSVFQLILKKVYSISQKGNAPRLWLQHLVCEAANFIPNEEIYVEVNEENREIVLQNHPITDNPDIHTVHVSGRKNRVSQQYRPLIDTAGSRYTSILSVQDKVEICVYKGTKYSRIVIRPLRYKLFEHEQIESPCDERIRLLSVCAGAGIGTSCILDSQYFTPIAEIEMEDDSAENLKLNYPNSYLFNGDLRDCHEVPKCDAAFVTLGCNEYSSLGDGEEGCFNNVALATYKILSAADPRVIFFENVPQFYQSEAFQDLRSLLIKEFPYWINPTTIESHDFGSIARRKRGYSLCFKQKEDFLSFQLPKPPKKVRRKKLREFLDPKGTTNHDWKPMNKFMDSFNSKAYKQNSWAERSLDKTFVTKDVIEIQCIAKRYRSHSASNSYLLSDDKTMWRFLSVSELRKILSIPASFVFSPNIGISRIYEMIGQSVDGNIIRAFANQIARMFFLTNHRSISNDTFIDEVPIAIEENEQLSLLFS